MKGITSDQGRQTLEQFKMEAANEVGVNLKNGYNGDLTSREAGSVGGQMVKKMTPIRSVKCEYDGRMIGERKMRVRYIAGVVV